MTASPLVAQLREEIKRATGPENGTIVRFESVSRTRQEWHDLDENPERRYLYAAVFTNDKWYLTGTRAFFGANVFSHQQFVSDVLARDNVENIAVASAFDTV